MERIARCFLLPIDGTDESIKSIHFLKHLYYPEHTGLTLILSYFVPPLPPIYSEASLSRETARKKKELIKAQKQRAHDVFDQARRSLVQAGFADENIQEHVQERAMSVARHACRLADIKRVDAVLIQKRITSSLEGFLKSDQTDALIRHCAVSPLWFTEGNIDPSQAAVCIQSEDASLRAVDHAAFMLAETETRINILHVSRSASSAVSCPAFVLAPELLQWLETDAGEEIMPFLMESREILKSAGIAEDRVRMTILPLKGKTASTILSYCREESTGIIVLGHSLPEGIWGFLKTSVTKQILADFKDMAVWVSQ